MMEERRTSIMSRGGGSNLHVAGSTGPMWQGGRLQKFMEAPFTERRGTASFQTFLDFTTTKTPENAG